MTQSHHTLELFKGGPSPSALGDEIARHRFIGFSAPVTVACAVAGCLIGLFAAVTL